MAHKLLVGSLSFSTSTERLRELDGRRRLKVALAKLSGMSDGPRRIGTGGGR